MSPSWVVIAEAVRDPLVGNPIHVSADRVEVFVRRDLGWRF